MERDCEFAAQDGVGIGKLERRLHPRSGLDCLDIEDRKLARIEHEFGGGRMRPDEIQGGDSGEGPGGEIELEIQVQMPDGNDLGVRERMFVRSLGSVGHGGRVRGAMGRRTGRLTPGDAADENGHEEQGEVRAFHRWQRLRRDDGDGLWTKLGRRKVVIVRVSGEVILG